MTINETQLLGFLDGACDVASADPEIFKLAPWGLEFAIALAAVAHMFEDEKVEEATAIDARGTPRIAAT